MCRVTRQHTRKHDRISTKELEAKLSGHPRHQALCSFEGAEILRPRLSYGCRPDSISPAALLGSGIRVDGKQPRAKPLSVAAGRRRFLGEGELQSRRATVLTSGPRGFWGSILISHIPHWQTQAQAAHDAAATLRLSGRAPAPRSHCTGHRSRRPGRPGGRAQAKAPVSEWPGACRRRHSER